MCHFKHEEVFETEYCLRLELCTVGVGIQGHSCPVSQEIKATLESSQLCTLVKLVATSSRQCCVHRTAAPLHEDRRMMCEHCELMM